MPWKKRIDAYYEKRHCVRDLAERSWRPENGRGARKMAWWRSHVFWTNFWDTTLVRRWASWEGLCYGGSPTVQTGAIYSPGHGVKLSLFRVISQPYPKGCHELNPKTPFLVKTDGVLCLLKDKQSTPRGCNRDLCITPSHLVTWVFWPIYGLAH